LKRRRVGNREVLSLFDEGRGTVALPQDWTDQAAPSPYATSAESPPILHPVCLVQLLALLQTIQKGVDDAR
jgi:hypothetical protein